jgi:hypothetical protein
MNAGRIFRDDPTTQLSTAALVTDATVGRMALSQHIARVESSIRTMLSLTREPDAQAQSDLRERAGNVALAVRGLAALVHAVAPSDPRVGWFGRLERPAAIDRKLLAGIRDEALADAQVRLAALQRATRGALGEGLGAAQARLDELQNQIASVLGA